MKQPFGSVVLDAASRMMVPFIMLFALYVLFHGHYSPGGGFQAGTILAAGVILIRLVRGSKPGWGIGRTAAAMFAAAGVSIYAGVGMSCVLLGGKFLDYAALPVSHSIPHARNLGILGVEIGVTLGVMGTMILIFDCLSDRKKDEE